MKVQLTKKDYIWSYLGYFFTLFSNIIILPLVMKLVSSAELGLWYTFLSIGNFVNIMDNSFANAISRNVTYAWSGCDKLEKEGCAFERISDQPNFRLFTSIMLTCQKIYFTVAVIAALFMASIGTIYINYTARNFTSKSYLIAWLIYIIAIFCNLYYSYWIQCLKGIGYIKAANQANVISRIFQILVSYIGLLVSGDIIVLSVAYFVSGIVLREIGKHNLLKDEVKMQYEKYKKVISKQEIKNVFSAIWFNAKKVGLTCLGAYGINQTTTLICSAYLGVEVTASYGLILQITTAFAGVAMILYQTMRPQLTEIVASGQKELFKEKISIVAMGYVLVYLCELIVFIIIGIPLVELWKSNTAIPLFMVIILGVYSFLENNHSLFAGIIELSNRIPFFKASLLSALLIIGGELAISFLGNQSIYGLILVQMIVQLSYNNWKWPYMVMKENGLKPNEIIRIGTIGLWKILSHNLNCGKHT